MKRQCHYVPLKQWHEENAKVFTHVNKGKVYPVRSKKRGGT